MRECIKSLKRFARNKKAISGLETAIVLIAFVIVASAFAYAVLNMGFLATQKSQQVVLGGLQAASSAIIVDGPVYGYSNQTGPDANLTIIVFWLKMVPGGTSVDLSVNKTTITFQNSRGVWPNIYNTGGRSLSFISNSGGIQYTSAASATSVVWEIGQGMALKSGDRVRIAIQLTQLTMAPTNPTGIGACINQAEGCPQAGEVMNNEEFHVFVKPPSGSMLDVDRIAPAEISPINDLG